MSNTEQSILNLDKYSDTYQIVGKIGSGGGGTIYKAFHIRLEKYVVLKKIHENKKIDMSMIRREADILKNLRHSYLPQVFDFLILDSGIYTVMDYIPGKSLKEIMDSGYRFTEKEITKFAVQLCEALAYLHSQNPLIIHGDIKPANIMLTPKGNVCLIDFNISGVVDQYQNAYVMGYSQGYAAPEQIKAYEEYKKVQNKSDDKTAILEDNEKTAILEDEKQKELIEQNIYQSKENEERGIRVDTRADVFSLAATIYHMLTGRKFDLNGENNALTDAEDGLYFILKKALNLEPSRRYPDAVKMLDAFRNIHKLDQRYRRIILKQQMLMILFICLGTVGVITAVYGYYKIKDERINTYYDYAEKLSFYRENQMMEEFEECYDKAVELMPKRLEAYYEQALYFFEQGQYEQSINYINAYILTDDDKLSASGIADIYYLLGRDYFELEEYENAVQSLQQAVSVSDDNNPDYYIEYAISLVRMGQPEKAEIILENAEEMGASTDMIFLTKGEIEKYLGHYDSAYENFMNCIEVSANDYVRMRAYIICSEIYEEKGVLPDNYAQQIVLLEKARVDLPFEYQAMILQRLAQAYIHYGTLTDEGAAYDSAITVLKQIIDYGWGNYSTYSSLVVLYEKNGHLTEAQNILCQIEDEYANYYALYKRKAFLEIDIQRQYDQENRDYSNFLEYYTQAVQLYEENGSMTDTEMTLLNDLYEQMKEGNWFNEGW